MTASSHAIFVLAYGTPEKPEDVEAYFTHIRGGRTPSPESVRHLREKYEKLGGRTPLKEITDAVADGLRGLLRAEGRDDAVYVGMKHWHPYIKDVMHRMYEDGIRSATAIVLAPHYSKMSIGGYRKYIEEANAQLPSPIQVDFIERWGEHPAFLSVMEVLVRDGLRKFPETDRQKVTVVFSAHSLPQKIREWGDPYEAELKASAAAVADRIGITDWRWAWQSAGGTTEPWLGPDILDYLEELAAEGVSHILQVPIGFTAEHLEVWWDIDYEAREKAGELGMALERTERPNARPDFVAAVRAVIADHAPSSRGA
jgi:ferrochelatase